MLTNILLINLLIVLISGIVYIRHLIKFHFKANIDMLEIKTNNIHSSIAVNKVMTLEIKEKLLPRIEQQEKLIADLQATQAPEEVVETVNLISEWLTGPSDN